MGRSDLFYQTHFCSGPQEPHVGVKEYDYSDIHDPKARAFV